MALWAALGEAGTVRFAFSDRMSSPRRGCPAAMPQSTWLERTSSTLCEGQSVLGPKTGPSEREVERDDSDPLRCEE